MASLVFPRLLSKGISDHVPSWLAFSVTSGSSHVITTSIPAFAIAASREADWNWTLILTVQSVMEDRMTVPTLYLTLTAHYLGDEGEVCPVGRSCSEIWGLEKSWCIHTVGYICLLCQFVDAITDVFYLNGPNSHAFWLAALQFCLFHLNFVFSCIWLDLISVRRYNRSELLVFKNVFGSPHGLSTCAAMPQRSYPSEWGIGAGW